MRNYQKLDAWKMSMELIKNIYSITKKYPKEEMFGLTSQTKRAAVSVSANIAEGLGRQYKKDTIHFLHIARGSIYELETHLNVAIIVGIIEEATFEMLIPIIDDVVRLLNGFINYLEKSNLK